MFPAVSSELQKQRYSQGDRKRLRSSTPTTAEADPLPVVATVSQTSDRIHTLRTYGASVGAGRPTQPTTCDRGHPMDRTTTGGNGGDFGAGPEGECGRRAIADTMSFSAPGRSCTSLAAAASVSEKRCHCCSDGGSKRRLRGSRTGDAGVKNSTGRWSEHSAEEHVSARHPAAELTKA